MDYRNTCSVSIISQYLMILLFSHFFPLFRVSSMKFWPAFGYEMVCRLKDKR